MRSRSVTGTSIKVTNVTTRWSTAFNRLVMLDIAGGKRWNYFQSALEIAVRESLQGWS
jgi:hypothetical protein